MPVLELFKRARLAARVGYTARCGMRSRQYMYEVFQESRTRARERLMRLEPMGRRG